MKHVKTIGNIKVCAIRNAENDYTISLYNGSDCIYDEFIRYKNGLRIIDR